MIRFFINFRMVGEVFSIINGSLFDFIDGRINFFDRDNLIVRCLPVARPMFNHPACGTQIRQGMQVKRMIRCART